MRSAWDGLAQSRRWGATRLHRVLTTVGHHVGALVVSGLILVLVVMVGIGTGFHPRTAQALDGGAWLGSSTGILVHANGTSARVDWVLDAAAGNYQVIQQGPGGLVDHTAGQAQSIDASSMSLSKPTALGSDHPELAAGAGHAYVVHRDTGVVTPVDPATLAPTGPDLHLGGGVGSTAVDGQGVLYAVVTPSGTVDTIDDGALDAQVIGGSSSGQLVSVGGSVVEVDHRDDALTSLAADGTATSVALGLPADADLAIPAAAASSPFWITDTSTGTIVGLQPGHGITDRVPVGSDGRSLGAPQGDGGVVYLEDSASGSMLTVDLRTRATAHQAIFPPGADVSLFPKDGLVWGNDFDGPQATVADGHGAVHVIQKYIPAAQRAPRSSHKPVRRTTRPSHRTPKARATARKAKRRKTKKVKVHRVAPTPTTVPATTSTTLPTCPTTTTTTTTASSTSSTSSSTTTTLPCRPGTTTTTTCPPPTSSTTSTTEPDTSSTSSSTTTTEADTTTTTNPCQPTTTTSTTSTTTTTTSTTTP